MNDPSDERELFPDIDAGAALRAAFQKRDVVDASRPAMPHARSGAPRESRGYERQGEIASGGMGVIVKAVDRELGREVALKVLRDELSKEPKLVQRFFEEARITARLDHPGIVPVHEVGRGPDGLPYFAMRLVRGRELRRIIELAHAGAEGWNRTRALSVIQKVCEAMAYAHDKGVIHRDLKPSNVMVGEFGEVYVMDWGLARSAGSADAHDLRLRSSSATRIPSAERDGSEERDTSGATASADTSKSPTDSDSPIVTMDGEVLGTPCYMAPEQALGRTKELGPRSDIYAVGAMLYHLLAGEMPYVPRGSGVAGFAVLKQLVDGPPRPLHELRRDVPAELAAVCEKAMSRDPAQRYPSMLAMADDLRAFLEGRVVRAYESGGFAEGKKWVQRNRGLAAALALFVFALAAGLVVSLSLEAKSDENFTRAEHNAQQASDERDRALAVASFLEDTLKAVAPSVALGRDTTMLREMMSSAWSRIERGELSAAPEAELRLMLVIGGAFDDIGQYDEAEIALRQFVTKAEGQFHADDPLLARGSSQLGEVLREKGDLDSAEPFSVRGLAMHRRLFHGDHLALAESLQKLAGLLSDKGDLAAAEALARESLSMRERLIQGDDPSIALAANNLGCMLHKGGDLSGADASLRQAVDMQERLFHGDHPALASSLDNLASLTSTRGDLPAAEALSRRALEMRRRIYPGDHPMLALSLANVGQTLCERGKLEEAEPLLREALEMRRRLFKGDHLLVAQAIGGMALLLQARGDLIGADPLYREAIAMMHRLFPGDNDNITVLMSNLAVVLKNRGELTEAEALYRESLDMERRLYPGDHPDVAISQNNLASLLEVRGDPAGAEAYYREALGMQQRLTPGDNSLVAKLESNIAALLQHKGDLAGAEALARDALAMRRRLTQGDHPDVAKCASNLASVLFDRGDTAAADALFREALRMYQATVPATDPRIAVTNVGIGGVLTLQQRFVEADEILLAAATALTGESPAIATARKRCAEKLVANYAAWDAADPGKGHAERAQVWMSKPAESGKQ